MNKEQHITYDVIVIGGGITGAGVARDCAMRGLKVLLVEKYDLTNGATGRNHGLLHSGARYAVTDRESATECIQENMTLRKIARHCVEETDGLFITLPEDDILYQQTFVDACRNAGIHGATVLTYHEVTRLIINNGRVEGVVMRDNITGEMREAHAQLTINAAGIWGHLIAEMADVPLNMFPAKGSLLIFGHRVNQMVINRCRKPANADILVPDDAVCVIGTTSDRVSYDVIDHLKVTPEEVDILISEGEKLAPALATTRILRAYAGVRPLVAADNDPSGRNISRGIVLLDHEKRDGLGGFITITGGKMMTYRLMAELATDLACKKLGVNKTCETAEKPLPGSEEECSKKGLSTERLAEEGRHGTLTSLIPADTIMDKALVCECEEVSIGEMKYAVDKLHVKNLINMRRRTRVSMGTCQGTLCACRAACVLCNLTQTDAKKSQADLASVMAERWKGMRPVAWGDTLKESQLMSMVYEGLCGLNQRAGKGKEIAR